MKELVRKLVSAEPKKFEHHHKKSLIALTYLEKGNPPENELEIFRTNESSGVNILFCRNEMYAGQLFTKRDRLLKLYGHAT